MIFSCVFFFFKQKTAYEMRISDWSSDVCSSDLRSLIGGKGFLPALRRFEGLSFTLQSRERVALPALLRARQPVRGRSIGGAKLQCGAERLLGDRKSVG